MTQEQHVFVGTLAENLRLARPRRLRRGARRRARRRRRARVGRRRFRTGSRPWSARAAHPLTPAQAQQLALARLVLADPHTLVLDEATSLLDPRAARHLERSLGLVLAGRTVVAIAHRLHTAHDADRVAVVEDGLLQRARDARRARRPRRLLRRALGVLARLSARERTTGRAVCPACGVTMGLVVGDDGEVRLVGGGRDEPLKWPTPTADLCAGWESWVTPAMALKEARSAEHAKTHQKVLYGLAGVGTVSAGGGGRRDRVVR